VLLGACGIKLDEPQQLGASPDAGTVDASVMIDGPPPLPTGPFGVATKVIGVSTDAAPEDDVTLNLTETEMIFAIVLNNNKDLYSVQRANAQAAWGTPVALTLLNAAGSDSAPRLSADGLTLYFGATRGGASEDAWQSKRANVTAPWQTKTVMPAVNSAAVDRWYNPCGGRYVLVSDRGTAGDLDLYEGAEGQAPTRLPISTTGANDISPFLTSDCLTLYWSHDADIYMATRTSMSAAWQVVGVSKDLSTTTFNEQDPWMSPDRHRMYFASNADGENDIYMATR
jgi:Tol biopolymer transport system component